MGMLIGIQPPGGVSPSKQPGSPATPSQTAQAVVVTELQKILIEQGVLLPINLSKRYDMATHAAIKTLSDKLMAADPKSALAKFLNQHYGDGEDATVGKIARNQDAVAAVLREIQRSLPRPETQRSLQDTPYYAIDLPGRGVTQMPLAFVHDRGYPMYQAILETMGLINMSDPLDKRLEDLRAATQAILKSLNAEGSSSANIVYIITEAYKDLVESWQKRAGAGTLADALGSWVPEFKKASDSQKQEIITAISYSFSSAPKFMELPPTINSRVTDMNELLGNRGSLIGFVSEELRRRGLMR